jgi:ankyrin repeat protein
VFDVLLELGLNVDSEDGRGFTPLRIEAQQGKIVCVKKLLKRGATVHVQNPKGATPLDLARHNGHSEIVRCLGGTTRKSWWRIWKK